MTAKLNSSAAPLARCVRRPFFFIVPGKKLLPRIQRIDDADALLALQRALSSADDLDDFRRALP